MLKQKISIFIFIFFLLHISFAQNDTELLSSENNDDITLKVGVYDNYPLVFVDQNKKVKGIFPEVFELVAKKNNWKIEYVHRHWDELLTLLENQEIDCVLAMAKTNERLNKYYYTNVADFENYGVVYSNRNEDIFKIHELNNKKVGVLKGDVYYTGEMGIANLSKSFGIQCDFITFNTYDEVLKAVESGEVNAGVVNRMYGLTNAPSFDIRNTNILFNKTKIYIAFAKTSQSKSIIAFLDDSIIDLMDNPESELHKIHSKYLKQQSTQSNTNSLLINIAISLLVLIFFVLIGYYVRFKLVLTRKAQRRIRESEERYRNLYETALVGLFRVNLVESTIIAANETCVKMFGYDSVQEFIEKFRTVESYVHTGRRDEILDLLSSKKHIEAEEVEVTTKDGTRIWVSMSERFYEEEGFSEGTIVDITERKRIEQKIQEKANRLSALNKIITSANKYNNLERILREILESTLNMFQFDSGCIHFIDEVSKTTNLQCSHNITATDFAKVSSFPILDTISKVVYLDGKAEFAGSEENTLTETIKNMGYRTGAIIPLMSQGKVIGTFIIANKSEYSFTSEEKDLLNSIGYETGNIIRKMQIENELRRNKENLQTMFDSIEDFIFIFDETGNILDFNTSVSTRLGYDSDELLNMTIFDVQHPNTRILKDTFLKDIISNTRNIVNYSLYTKFHAEIPVETKISYGTWGDKEVYFAISRDISERLLTEYNLRTSEQRNRALVESLPDMLFVINKEGTCLDFKVRKDHELYIPHDEIVGSNIIGIMPKTVSRRAKTYLKKAFETKQVQVFEYMLKVATGLEHYEARFSISSQSEAICLVRNISDRKRMEEALASEKEQLSLTLKSIGDGVITTDTHGKIILLNDASERLTGFKQSEASRMKLREVFRIYNENTHELCQDPFSIIVKSKDKSVESSNVVLESKIGEEISISYNAVPIRDKENRFHGIVIVFRDERLTKKLENEIIRATKLESLGILAGGIAHDFNNFITAILGNSTLGKIYAQDDENLAELFDEIKKASTRAKDLTYQLLTFSKGGAPILKTTSISDIIKETASFTLRGSNVLCKFAIYGELWNVEIDTGQINQVFNNIIINADQSMPDGGILEIFAENYLNDPSVTPALKGKKYVKITVHDEGTGIPEDVLPRIFDPYFTTKKTGSGLGLATAYSIIQNHEGLIDVDSDSTGTTFFIYLPASSKKIDTGVVKTEDAIMGEGTILVMDDEEIIRTLADNLLKHLGYTVILAKDGEDAIDIYSKAYENNEPIDLLIMDLTVPGGMGGKEALENILAINPEAKAIVSSGYYADPVLSEYKKYGFVGVLTKPYEIGELSEIISNAINNKQESDD